MGSVRVGRDYGASSRLDGAGWGACFEWQVSCDVCLGLGGTDLGVIHERYWLGHADDANGIVDRRRP